MLEKIVANSTSDLWGSEVGTHMAEIMVMIPEDTKNIFEIRANS